MSIDRWGLNEEQRAAELAYVIAERKARGKVGRTTFSLGARQTPYKMHELLDLVGDITGLPKWVIKANTKLKHVTAARALYMWLANRYTIQSLRAVALVVGCFDHTTAHHARKRVAAIVDRHRQHMPSDSAPPEEWADALWRAWRSDLPKLIRDRKKIPYVGQENVRATSTRRSNVSADRLGGRAARVSGGSQREPTAA